MILFIICALIVMLSFSINLDIKGCPCRQIMTEKDCSNPLLACKWSNETKTCSIMPCNERPFEQCRIIDSFFHYDAETYLCQFNLETKACQDYVTRDCSQVQITLTQGLSEEEEDEAEIFHQTTCFQQDCNYDKTTRKCKNLISDCEVLNKEQCTSQALHYGNQGYFEGTCVWIQEPWKDWTGKCSHEILRIDVDCSQHLSYDYCNPFSRCLWVKNKCDSYVCEDLSGTLGRSYCDLLYEINNETGFNVCTLNEVEKMCEKSSPEKLNATNCQEKTYNAWFYNLTSEKCEPCTELAQYRSKSSYLMKVLLSLALLFMII